MNITLVAGARPNFMKVAPLIYAMDAAIKKGNDLSYRIVHTGQHYDHNLSAAFFDELNIPAPHVNLGCGSGTQAEQTASIMVRFEKDLIENPSDLVIVVGDVTSTMACSVTAKKLNTKVAHIEAGIRSFDLSMPEEINRMVTDSITDYFFTTSQFANDNLRKAGIPDDRIFFVGNVMIDTLMANRNRFTRPALWDRIGLKNKNYIVMTLHRPANVDDPDNLRRLLDAVTTSSHGLPVIFPVHPRTLKIISTFSQSIPPSPLPPVSLSPLSPSLHLTDPLSYLEFNYLVERALAVITDSGGITEETTVMDIPCMTLRDTTERPETCTIGTNMLIGTDPARLTNAMEQLFSNGWKRGRIPELWDGRAAERIVVVILNVLKGEIEKG